MIRVHFPSRLAGAGVAALAVCAVLLTVPAANADLDPVIFRIEAQTPGGGFGAFVGRQGDGHGQWNGDTYEWVLDRPVTIRDSQNPSIELGWLTGATISYVRDPEVNMTFSVQANNSNTVFEIGSALLSFPTINNAIGSTSAAYTLTDFNGDGASLTGIGDTGGAYLAQYNGWATMRAGTTFAEEIAMMSAGPFQSVNASVNVPNSGTLPIGVGVFDMSALVSFELSAHDLASGTTNFVITPEPAAFAALAFGLALIRRR